MASVTNNAAVVAGNGLGPATHIVSIDTDAATVAAAIAEATTGDANDNVYTVAAVEGTADNNHIALQGATAAPDLTGGTVVVSFVQNP
jgi:hypothetical protein